MRTRSIATAAVVVVLAGAVTAGTGGTAAAAPAEAKAGSHLALRVIDNGTGERWGTSLECYPSGGEHPDAKAACRTLKKARGDFDRIKPNEGPCTMELRPVTLRAKGWWWGRHVSWSKEYSNPCVANRATDGVFDFAE